CQSAPRLWASGLLPTTKCCRTLKDEPLGRAAAMTPGSCKRPPAGALTTRSAPRFCPTILHRYITKPCQSGLNGCIQAKIVDIRGAGGTMSVVKGEQAGDKQEVASERETVSPTLLSAVTNALEEAIVRGEFLPGSALREVSLAGRFKASRGTVREALRALSEQG